jgi:hypothetical protein
MMTNWGRIIRRFSDIAIKDDIVSKNFTIYALKFCIFAAEATLNSTLKQ